MDAALSLVPVVGSPARFTLLHVTSPAAADAAHGAYRGCWAAAGTIQATDSRRWLRLRPQT